jgi:hypothetical protein
MGSLVECGGHGPDESELFGRKRAQGPQQPAEVRRVSLFWPVDPRRNLERTQAQELVRRDMRRQAEPAKGRHTGKEVAAFEASVHGGDRCPELVDIDNHGVFPRKVYPDAVGPVLL